MKSQIAAIIFAILLTLAVIIGQISKAAQTSTDIALRVVYGGLFWALFFTPVIVAYIRHRTNIVEHGYFGRAYGVQGPATPAIGA